MADFRVVEVCLVCIDTAAVGLQILGVLNRIIGDAAVADARGALLHAADRHLGTVGVNAAALTGHGSGGAVHRRHRVVLDDTVAQGGVGPHIDTRAVFRASAVLDGEAVPGHGRGRREVRGLVEYASCILSVQDGDVGGEVAQREVVVGRLVARESAIHAYSLSHHEGVAARSVAVVGARRHPDHRMVRGCQVNGSWDGVDGVRPALAGAGSLLSHIDDAVRVGRQRHLRVGGFVAAQIDHPLLDTCISIQVGGVGHAVVALVGAGGTVRQMPVGVGGVVQIACGERGVHEMGRHESVGGVIRQKGDNVVAAFVTALERAVADDKAGAGVVFHQVVHHPVDTVTPENAVLNGKGVVIGTVIGV